MPHPGALTTLKRLNSFELDNYPLLPLLDWHEGHGMTIICIAGSRAPHPLDTLQLPSRLDGNVCGETRLQPPRQSTRFPLVARRPLVSATISFSINANFRNTPSATLYPD
ncbi:hypothetical protein R3P38DRAFT_3222511 [Favolaschia claudopus]|uniref:Uncharacterized protein n=1 Tax=Favolaschia claudopus TaxID=2862362 RepID=A0AAV9ZYX5_9AGAR